MRSERTEGVRRAKSGLIWACVLAAESLHVMAVLKLEGTQSENLIIITLALCLVVVGILMGFNFAGVFGSRYVIRNANAGQPTERQERQRGWVSRGKPEKQPIRKVSTKNKHWMYRAERERAQDEERVSRMDRIAEERINSW